MPNLVSCISSCLCCKNRKIKKKGRKINFVSVNNSLVHVAISTSNRDDAAVEELILENLDKHELRSYFTDDFDADGSFYKMMYDKNRTDDWIKAATEAGIFFAKYRECADKNNGIDLATARVSCTSVLHDWLMSIGSFDKAYLKLRCKNARSDKRALIRIKERANEALKILAQSDSICLQTINLKTTNFTDGKIQFAGRSIKPAYGPSYLDMSIFYADILIMSRKLLCVCEHHIWYKTADMAYALGCGFDDEMKRQGLTETARSNFWDKIALLSGWEIVRRFITRQDVEEIMLHSNDSRKESNNVCEFTGRGFNLIDNRFDNYAQLVRSALGLGC